MEKNTIIAIVLSALVIIAFGIFQYKTTPIPTATEALPAEQNVSSETESTSLVNNAVTSVIQSSLEIEKEEIDLASEEIEQVEEIIHIKNSKVDVTLTNKGGDIIGFELLDHEDGDHGIQMADSISTYNRAFALSFDRNSSIINDYFKVEKISDLAYGFYKNFTIKNADGTESVFTLVKQYTFAEDDYMFKLDIIIKGDDNFKGLDFNNASYVIRTAPQIGPFYDKKSNRYENRTFMSYKDKKKKQVLGDNQTKVYDKPFTWTGVAGKYFVELIVPMNTTSVVDATYSTKFDENEYTNAQVLITRSPLLQNSVQDTYYVYAGPRTEKELAKYNKAENNFWKLNALQLNESIESTGILSWLEAIMKFFMEMIYKIIPNWGVSIIVMTILLKLAMFPLTKKSTVATVKMQELQPQIKEIQEKYANNKEKLNIEMAKFYQEAGYNPMSSCLPLLLQFPLIIAMYNLFNNYFEFRGAMFIPGWIPDLSIGDSVMVFGFSIPFGIGNHLRILPIIYVFSQLLFGKINQANTSAGSNATQMKIMNYAMPLFFFFIFYNAPSGLLLYWITTNILSLVQQVITNKIMKTKKQEIAETNSNKKVIKNSKKK